MNIEISSKVKKYLQKKRSDVLTVKEMKKGMC